ncbi:MAG: RNA polymerase sigma factor [Clostridium sp.]|nr:RNA polymerase sigma factor [Clostridium sp.]
MTDKELIRKVHNGNREALSMIISKYYDEIYRFCFYLTGYETDSYDITQEVFLKFIRYADSYQYKNLKGYLLIIARNLCFDFFRHKKENVRMEEIVEAGRDDAGMKNIEDGLMIKQALLKIPVEQREVIVLKIYEELKFMEIAGMLGCNISTVKSRYHLGLKKLRKIMEEESEK